MHSLTISTQFHQQPLSLVILSELLLLLQTTCVFAEVVVVANTIVLCVTVSFHFKSYSWVEVVVSQKLFMRSVCVSQILFAVAIFLSAI